MWLHSAGDWTDSSARRGGPLSPLVRLDQLPHMMAARFQEGKPQRASTYQPIAVSSLLMSPWPSRSLHPESTWQETKPGG